MNPKVTFIIPCYKLAHLLSRCIESILAQTYSDFDVLIMDDCSPDNTPDVVRSFPDFRIKHIRNETNIGHLANYNKGIGLATGKYVWLISADDYLRTPIVLARYVGAMEKHRNAGYVFCPAMKVQDGQELGLVDWSQHGNTDAVFMGHEFLAKLLRSNCVVAPTGMVRKECYSEVGTFPLNMPNSGDWYLWCVFALHYDVVYLAEPMVCYRVHDKNMSEGLKKTNPHIITNDNFAVRWTLKNRAEALGDTSVVSLCKDAIATYYSHLIADELSTNIYHRTLEECEQSIACYAANRDEEVEIRTRLYTALGDQYYSRHDINRAVQWYRASLHERRCSLRTLVKYLLLHLGGVGVRFRDSTSGIKL